MELELRHLHVFLVVAEEGHVTRAAERLGMQQPPLSQRIKAIERTMQVQLFRRKGRGIELTDAGRTLQDHARAMLDARDAAIAATHRAARGELGRLSVGVTPTGPFHPIIQNSIRAYRERYPNVSLTLEECLRAEMLGRLHRRSIDVAFLRADLTDESELEVRQIQTEPLMAALPSGHRLAQSTAALRISELKNETFIMYARQFGPAFYEATVAACRKAGFAPRIGQEAPRITSALSLIAAGLGVGVVPASMRSVHIEGVIYRSLIPMKELKGVLNITSRRGDSSLVVRNFLSIVRQSASSARMR